MSTAPNSYMSSTGFVSLQKTDLPSGVLQAPSGVSIVGNGQPTLVVSYDQTAQSAILSSVSLVSSLPMSGLYRLSGYLKKTTAATTSSTLGPLTVSYTEGTDSTSLLPTAALLTSAGAITTTNATNSATVTGSNTIVPLHFYAKVGTAVSFSLTYASSGTTAMVYEIHLRLELL